MKANQADGVVLARRLLERKEPMTTETALAATNSVEAALIEGDLGKLSPAERALELRTAMRRAVLARRRLARLEAEVWTR